MHKLVLLAVLIGALGTPVAAEAKGCIKGAIVGGVAGHIAGHGKLGALAGCIVGHHEANKHQDARPEQQPQQNRAGQ
jgi:biotin transporter BioY